MRLTGTTHLLAVGLGVLSLLALALAAGVLLWHRWSTLREARVARDSHALAVAFARFLSGRVDAVTLVLTAVEARPQVFWAAVETFADSVAEASGASRTDSPRTVARGPERSRPGTSACSTIRRTANPSGVPWRPDPPP